MKLYKTYNFDNLNYESLYVVGDLHGLFELFRFKLKELKITNSIFIVAGDCGFGFEKKGHYLNIYRKFSKLLLENNITILFLRGNHDDPYYFDGFELNYKNFICIPDYSIISFNNENILCIGGAVSVDRMVRKIDEINSGFKYKLYWNNESVNYRPTILEQIKNDNVNINHVITHTKPSFIPPYGKEGISIFLDADKILLDDLIEENKLFDNIFNDLVKKYSYQINNWVFGHFHQHSVNFYDGVRFINLDMFRTKNNSFDYIELIRK